MPPLCHVGHRPAAIPLALLALTSGSWRPLSIPSTRPAPSCRPPRRRPHQLHPAQSTMPMMPTADIGDVLFSPAPSLCIAGGEDEGRKHQDAGEPRPPHGGSKVACAGAIDGNWHAISTQSTGRAGTGSSGRSTGASVLMRTIMSSSRSPLPSSLPGKAARALTWVSAVACFPQIIIGQRSTEPALAKRAWPSAVDHRACCAF